MKKFVFFMVAMGMGISQSFAQATIDAEVDNELDQMYRARGTTPQAGSPAGATIAPQGAQSGQPIYILNQATPTSSAQAHATQVQKQPTTYIEASPLTKSRADQIREARQQVEAETESRIVEKLEQSRMEDEKRRANVLFGDQFNSLGQQQQAAPPVAPAPQQQVILAPQPVAPVAPAEDTRNVVREEIRAALDEEKQSEPEEPLQQKYFAGMAGVGEYPDVRNVRGNYVLGAAFGTKFDNTYAVEGSFTYSDYTVQKLDGYMIDPYTGIPIPALVDVQQYAASLAVKYYMMDGLVRPILGGLASYSYRKFSWSEENYGGRSYGSSNDATSHAIDLGVLTGVDFQLTPKFTLGADFRYMFNMNSRVNTSNNSSFLATQSYGTPIEKLQYYNLSLVGRVTF